ncbi:hypothetical protein Maes01_00121 [Microbulbifer aestuariivivens]|uniref:DUF637 domain-containing protein n=1 Tax=Microbulbifer aestuariivivens TaxID=1908308 RepID=A0ABP9WLU6_9GAMM
MAHKWFHLATADNYDFSFANNGLGTVNTGLTNSHVGNTSSELIAQNTGQLVTQIENNPHLVEYRPLRQKETEALDSVIWQIERAPYNLETRAQLMANAIAETCAKTHCAEGVPESDPHYQALKDLQASGEALIAGGQNLLGDSEEGLLEYDRVDGAQDALRANGEVIARVQGGTQAVRGGLDTAGSAAATVVSAPLCVATGVGCIATAGTASLTALSAVATLDGYRQATGEYQSSFGEEVFNNFRPETYQDSSNPAGDLAVAVGLDVALGAVGKVVRMATDAAGYVARSAKKSGSNNALDDAVPNNIDDAARVSSKPEW